MAMICDHLFLGSQDIAADLEILRANGITHVLNVATGVPCFFPDLLEYKVVEMLDLPEVYITCELESCLRFIEEVKEDGVGKVFVHCNAGVSRSAAVAIAYVMRDKGWTLDKAFTFVKGQRPHINPNAGFMLQLRMFGQQQDVRRTPA
jgi:protein-tyrosine phosphatase